MARQTERRPLTEREILALGSPLVTESLLLALGGRRGTMYVLTNTLYTTSSIGGVFSSHGLNSNMDITPIPKGDIGKFVESFSGQSDCVGFVPITEGAKKALEAKGLRIHQYGITLAPENVRFNLYG